MKSREKKIILLALAAFLIAALWGISSGAAKIPLGELFRTDNRPILLLRLARVFLALTAGGGLAVSGVALQALLRNPLAEPYLLGTSSGAGLGAVAGLLLGLSGIFLPLAAFLGAALTVPLVYRMSERDKRVTPTGMILAGVVVSMAFSAVIVFLVSISTLDTLKGALWWLWGGLEVHDPRMTAAVGAVVIAGTGILFSLSRELNAVSLGEEEAFHLGVDAEKIRKTVFYLTALMTASLVCVCGIIGFVGLLVPHAARLLVGPDHKTLLPVSALGGAAFLTVSDVLSRTLLPPLEIPVGVLTAVVGAPVFFWLLRRSREAR